MSTAFGNSEFFVITFLIPNFRHVLNVVCFLLGNSPASKFYMPTFLYSDPPLHYLPSYLLAEAIFEPNLFPNKFSNIFKSTHPSNLSAYQVGTECSETSVYKIQTPVNYPEENIQQEITLFKGQLCSNIKYFHSFFA
jgi:hypothetical protein